MLASIRSRLSSAHVIAVVALFVSLGGLAWALERNSVKSRHIDNDQVKSVDVRDDDLAGGGLQSADIAPEALTSADIQNRRRSVSIPLGSFIDCQTDAGAPLDFVSGADQIPDFRNSSVDGQGFTIRFDDDPANPDQNAEICSQLVVPDDYAGDGGFLVVISRDDLTGSAEVLQCGAARNGEPVGSPGENTLVLTATLDWGCTPPALDVSPGDALSFYLRFGSTGAIDDTLDVHAVSFQYNAGS